MKYSLQGDDSLSLRLRKQELIKNFYQKHPDGQVFIFSFPEALINNNIEAELSPGLFEQEKCIVFEDISKLYESSPERAEEIIQSQTPHDCIFIEYQKLAKSDPLLKIISRAVQSEEVYESKKRDAQKLISDLQSKLDLGVLDAKTLAILKERSGKDDDLLLQNIQKILTYTEGKPPTKDELDALVPETIETKVFDALDALVSGEKERALVLFQKILKEDDIFRIIPLCTWQIRQMLLVLEAKQVAGENKDAISRETGTHPYVVQKLLRALPSYPRPRLAKGLKLLSALDVELKQGQRTPEGAIQHLIFQW